MVLEIYFKLDCAAKWGWGRGAHSGQKECKEVKRVKGGAVTQGVARERGCRGCKRSAEDGEGHKGDIILQWLIRGRLNV